MLEVNEVTNDTTMLRQDILKRIKMAETILNSLTDEELYNIGNGTGTLYYKSLQS